MQLKRAKIKIQYNQKGSLHFLYNTILGRCCLKVITLPVISKIVGAFMNTRLSTIIIKPFIKKNNINMEEYLPKKYISYNDFFTREILQDKRKCDYSEKSFISPCDAKLTAYTITQNATFNIKGSQYCLSEIINDEELAAQYNNGIMLIFRLAVDDYHRFCYIDNGNQDKNIFIPGILHTVQPIALNVKNIYKTNSREYTILHTENFSDIIQIEVGALLVGKIRNLHQNYTFKKGEEKGYFEFGGSTICLVIKPNTVNIDEEFFTNTKSGFETYVKCKERIGYKNEENK